MTLPATRNISRCTMTLLMPKKLQFYLCPLFIHQPAKDEDSTALDQFTTRLVELKSSKWEKRKALAKNKATNSFSEISVVKNQRFSIQHMNIEAINDLFQQAIDYDDSNALVELTKQCTQFEKLPSLMVLIHSLSVCSSQGDKETIIGISQLCEKIRPELLDENSNFEHYIAEAVWVKGDIIKSLGIFKKVYKENIYLRRTIKNILKNLILSSVATHSEATLVALIHFSEMLVKDHKDYFTLGCLWQACILSEWFSDQQTALHLLEKYEGLCEVILNKIPFVVKASLKRHNTEVVYTLIEVLLKLKMDSDVSQVILALIDYFIQTGDFRQCKEIIMWSIQNDIQLPAVYSNDKLVRLLIKDDVDISIKLEQKKVRASRPTNDFKF